MCLQNLGSTVYDRLRSECEEHIESKLEALLGQTPDVLAFLSLMQACWTDHCEQMLTLRSIFLYLDRTFVMQVRLPCTARPPKCPAVPCVSRGRARMHRSSHPRCFGVPWRLRPASCQSRPEVPAALCTLPVTESQC